jgi:hypothetical protein
MRGTAIEVNSWIEVIEVGTHKMMHSLQDALRVVEREAGFFHCRSGEEARGMRVRRF